MSFADEKDDERRKRQDRQADIEPSQNQSRSRKRRPGSPEVGTALRSAYQRTIDEDIPPEMLDLLGKLG